MPRLDSIKSRVIEGTLYIFLGTGIFLGLLHAWRMHYEEVVLTIFPMMGTPYIIAGGLICAGLATLWGVVEDELLHHK